VLRQPRVPLAASATARYSALITSETFKPESVATTYALIMQPRLVVLTLGVDDLERAIAFYLDGLGFKTEGIIGREFEYGAVAFFPLQHGVQLAVWPRDSIARDTGLPRSAGCPAEFTLGHNVRTRAEVDQVMDQARKAGATIVKEPANTFWGGYAGYFQDPDGHLWEVVWNPGLLPED
jgi:uncharacterized protein